MSASPLPIDCLIQARWIAPVTPENTLLEDHSIAIDQGRILELLPTEQATKKYQAAENVNLADHLLIPGLINTHGHAAMSLFRGLSDDLPLQRWLQEHIWPAEQQWVNEDFVTDGTELAIAEMLLGGTTCFSDMYFFPDAAARVAHKHNIRAHIMVPLIQFPTAWAETPDDYFHKGLQVHDNYRNHDLIKIGFGPHATYTVTPEMLDRVRVLSEELDINTQIHLHETTQEISDAVAATGQRPIEVLAQQGLLTPELQCVHMTHLNDDDIELLKEHGTHVIHCPESNLKLASGFCPVEKLMSAGINVALGTDGAASNNDLDMLSEMRTAALLVKGTSGNAAAVNAHQALAMATINGAKALNIDNETGSLEAGKMADITAIDLSDIRLQPIYDPVSHLVYSASSRDVSHVWVNGKTLVENKQLKYFDLDVLRQKTQHWHDKISL